ncbi:hypothetical protein C8Q74DRAFT_56575 [Fomes fomentarius]|nr:hypothetical protein C8Q74DRAFT_56575 [Fomes fomentarius]
MRLAGSFEQFNVYCKVYVVETVAKLVDKHNNLTRRRWAEFARIVHNECSLINNCEEAWPLSIIAFEHNRHVDCYSKSLGLTQWTHWMEPERLKILAPRLFQSTPQVTAHSRPKLALQGRVPIANLVVSLKLAWGLQLERLDPDQSDLLAVFITMDVFDNTALQGFARMKSRDKWLYT